MTDNTTLVLGASGKSGRRVAARLRLRGVPVRAASRSSATPFDWSDPRGWDAALQGVAAVYIVPPGTVGPVHDFVARADAAGVGRLVLLSGRGADDWGDSDFGVEMKDAEQAVRSSRLEWTVLRPNNFAQNFDEELWHAPVLAGEVALPAGAVPEPLIDLEDVADVAATVLTEPGRHAGRIYELSGPQALTFADYVAMISSATGRPITYTQISPADYTEALVGQGLPADDSHHIAEMFVLMERGLIAGTTDGVTDVLGRP
ncbi:MAG: hypothetical protein K0R68_1596, partial [Mycobacterium sp.]|nr:hypothetical protein [Mycobacterium sp.]